MPVVAIVLLNVAAPAALMSSIRAFIFAPPSLPLNLISLSCTDDCIRKSVPPCPPNEPIAVPFCLNSVVPTDPVSNLITSLELIVILVPSPSIFSPSLPNVSPMFAGMLMSPFVAADRLRSVAPATVVAVTVQFNCNAVVGSEVPIPTRLFVTSRYSRFVSNARSVPFLVKFDFSTDPVIRPMAIPGTPYNNVSTAYAVHSFFIIAS